jgi:hypothetical protein
MPLCFAAACISRHVNAELHACTGKAAGGYFEGSVALTVVLARVAFVRRNGFPADSLFGRC